MELILWRHADAEPGEPDESRPLSPKGQKQAAKMADWLDRHLPNGCKILASPTVRTVQTAQALERKFKVNSALGPDSTSANILAAAQWPDAREPVLVIGHQPALGRLAALLITGIEQDWILRKGSICWIADKAIGEQPINYIKAVIAPDMLGK